MFLRYHVTFPIDIPSKEAIIQRIRDNTGLSDVNFAGVNNSAIAHPHFGIPWIGITYRKPERKIELFTTDAIIGYLLEASLAALEDLGGKSEHKIDDLARQKWEDVKDKYVEKPLIGNWPEDA